MIISLNWLKKFTNIDISIDELTNLINTRLVEIESVTNLGEKYDKILIVKVVSANKLEGSDHLSIVKIDDGGVTSDIVRDGDSFIQVVCGAPNIKAGQTVVWLPPKSVVPQTFGTAEPFVLDTRNLRGVVSNGMIASAKELDLFDEHDGILVLDGDIKPGSLFAKEYELDDYLLDIENKSLTHRPDCFGIVGFAREVSAIMGKDFTNPDWLMNLSSNFEETGDSIGVVIDDPKLSDRYQAVVMGNGDCKKQSPMIIQTYLARVGIRPISAIVDVTNYLMILTGQPLHAFDFDKMAKVAGGTYDYDIHVRAGRSGEKLELLDGRVISLTNDDIVIAAGETAVGLAGAMGGADTEIDDSTQSIIIESASFNLYKLRSTQMRHGIFSEAITRFTKGQPAELTAPVLGEAIKLINEWTGMKPSTKVADSYPGKKDGLTIKVPLQKVNNILGVEFSISDVVNLLSHVGFGIKEEDPSTMSVDVPYWRSDIHIVEDIVEEIGRINGFDNIKSTLPSRDFTAVKPDTFDTFRNGLRKLLIRAGANEVLTYSFVHGDIIEKTGQKTEMSYRLVNSISPDLQYYRQSLMPSLLDIAQPNIKQGFDEFALFEINKCHYKPDGLNSENVPNEVDRLALIVASKKPKSGAAYYQAKRLLDFVSSNYKLRLDYRSLKDQHSPIASPFEPRRSAELVDSRSGKVIGFIGEYKKSVARDFKLPEYSAGFEVNTRELFSLLEEVGNNYKPLSRYPSTERDICFKVDQSIECAKILDIINGVMTNTDINATVEVVDIYKQEGSDMKNITVRVKLVAYDRTLNGLEVGEFINSVVNLVVVQLGATVV